MKVLLVQIWHVHASFSNRKWERIGRNTNSCWEHFTTHTHTHTNIQKYFSSAYILYVLSNTVGLGFPGIYLSVNILLIISEYEQFIQDCPGHSHFTVDYVSICVRLAKRITEILWYIHHTTTILTSSTVSHNRRFVECFNIVWIHDMHFNSICIKLLHLAYFACIVCLCFLHMCVCLCASVSMFLDL